MKKTIPLKLQAYIKNQNISKEKDKELRAQYVQEQLDLLRDNAAGDYSVARKSLKELRGGYYE